MRTLFRSLVAATIFAGMALPALRADNYLKNADLKSGISFWRGDGKIAYLKPDGTEGEETDPGVTPVIKLALSHNMRRSVMQEFSARDTPTTLRIKVDILASKDFKRSTNPKDYTDFGITRPSSGSCGDPFIPNTDFWFILGPDFWYKSTNATIGTWVTVDHRFDSVDRDQDRAINFCVPYGDGAIYLKNFVVEK